MAIGNESLQTTYWYPQIPQTWPKTNTLTQIYVMIVLKHSITLNLLIFSFYSHSYYYRSRTSHHHGFPLVRYYFTSNIPLVMVILTALDRTKMSYNLPWVNAAYYKHRLLFDHIKWIDKG